MYDVTFDEAKRALTLEKRGLDFADAPIVFSTAYMVFVDDRQDYGEDRYISFGLLGDRHVAVVWTPRDEARRIISMRYAHDEEIEARRATLG